ncbi:NOB1 family endonuclease [Thermoproteota archaeon]
MKALVLDTSAFIQGFDTSNPKTQLYTTPKVIDEIKAEMAKIRAANWSQTGKLQIISPNESSLEHIDKQAQKMGEAKALSTTDHSVLALSHQLNEEGLTTILISDDYGIQNIADEIGLTYQGMITRGIKRRFQWINYCPGCKKQSKKPQQENICPICGTKLKRKPGKKTMRRAGE